MRMMNALRLSDSSLGTRDLAFQGVKGPIYDGGGVSSDDYARVYTNDSVAMVFFNHGDTNLSRDEVLFSINAVIFNRGLLKINTKATPHNIIASGDHQVGLPNCRNYTSPDHRATHEALLPELGGVKFSQFRYQVTPLAAPTRAPPVASM